MVFVILCVNLAMWKSLNIFHLILCFRTCSHDGTTSPQATETTSAHRSAHQISCVNAVLDIVVLYCILASCYIRFTRNICSFVHQCKQATWRPQRQHKYSNKRTLTISTPSAEAHGWKHHIGKNWHSRASASGEYTITPEDGRVRPKHVDE
jgi:hypothetical protein